MHRGLTCKLLHFCLNKHIISKIIELVCNCSFTLTCSSGKLSGLQHLKNGIPKKSILAPFLFNIYTHDLSETTTKKFSYADDLVISHSSSNWQALEATLMQDMARLSTYFQKRKLKFSTTTTMLTAFHLYIKETQRGLRILVEEQTLPFCAKPTYFSIVLVRAMAFCQHLKSLFKKLTTCIKVFRQLVGSSWDVSATILCTTTLALLCTSLVP